MKNSVTKISDFSYTPDEQTAWNRVKDTFNVVTTLDKVNPKAIIRAGKMMETALADLFEALRIYDHMRCKQ
jgi:hypothetical protein